MSDSDDIITNVGGVVVLKGITAKDFDPDMTIEVLPDGTIVMPDGIHPNSIREFYGVLAGEGVEPMPEGTTKEIPINYRISSWVFCG